MSKSPLRWMHWLRRMAPWAAVLLYLAMALPQLDLPGLHYDEAKEAGINAMEMLLRQDVHAFRSAGLQIGTIFLPLMVQDYIGALNVYLALPFMALFGITVPALRWLAVACGLVTLVILGQLAHALATGPGNGSQREHWAGPVAMLLLSTSPSFIFWSRQGIFVTNVVVALSVAVVWAAARWRHTGRPRYLYLMAFLAGLGLWAKLLFAWVLGALAGVALAVWVLDRRTQGTAHRSQVSQDRRQAADREDGLRTVRQHSSNWHQGLMALLLFLAALSPLLLFNQQTSGTLSSIFGNLGQSYYGVRNTALLENLQVRLGQVVNVLRGDHFWYLGGPFANELAPWLALALVATGLIIAWRNRPPQALNALLLSLLFLLLLILQSIFTVSDLFVTHYAILQPFLLLPVALAADGVFQAASDRWRAPKGAGKLRRAGNGSAPVIAITCVLMLAIWMVVDLRTDLRYHRALAATGGHATHSDASQRLADWLTHRATASPLALDWGIDAPVRYLTANRVKPLELFGYERLDAPDGDFAGRLAPFLDDPARLYVLHTPGEAIFQGRREVLETLAAARGSEVVEEATFLERSGRPIFLVLRLREEQ